MPLQILILKLDGITAGDYLTWCRDPDPPALDHALRSISIDADPLGDTIIAILDWHQAPPPSDVAASAAGLALSTGVQIDATPIERSHSAPFATGTEPRLTGADAALAQAGELTDDEFESYTTALRAHLDAPGTITCQPVMWQAWGRATTATGTTDEKTPAVAAR